MDPLRKDTAQPLSTLRKTLACLLICNALILLIMNYAFVFLRDLCALCGKMTLLLAVGCVCFKPVFLLFSAVIAPACAGTADRP